MHRVRQMMTTAVIAAAVAPAAAQVHATDFVLRMDGQDRIEPGLVDGSGTLTFPGRVNTALLGAEGFPNFTNDPGWDSVSGAFPNGTGIGFVVLGPLLEWDGSAFSGNAEFPMVLRKFGVDTITPSDDSEVVGPLIGATNSTGRFHHHVQFFFNEAQPVNGLFLLSLRLYADNAAVQDSEPLYIVFAQGSAAVADQLTAVQWVEDNLIGTPCPADLAEPAGVLNIDDVLAFLGAFADGDMQADLADPVGVLNIDDVLAFLGAFAAGCP